MSLENPTKQNIDIKAFKDLMRASTLRKDYYEETLSQDVEIPNFPTNPLSAKWTLSFGEGNFRGIELSINRKENGTECLAEIRIDDRWEGTQKERKTKPHFFDITHRFVHKDQMNEDEQKIKGVGSFILKTVEEVLRSISDKDSPKEIGMLTNQPSVMRLAENNGYKITNESQKKDYSKFVKELEDHKNDPLFIEKGILPHFRFVNLQVNLNTYVNEGAIINLDMLRYYCDTKQEGFEDYLPLLEENGDIEKAKVPVKNPNYAFLEIDINEQTARKEQMRSPRPHPVFMDFYFSKKL